jgi:hypothetical protein
VDCYYITKAYGKYLGLISFKGSYYKNYSNVLQIYSLIYCMTSIIEFENSNLSLLSSYIISNIFYSLFSKVSYIITITGSYY